MKGIHQDLQFGDLALPPTGRVTTYVLVSKVAKDPIMKTIKGALGGICEDETWA